MDDDKPKFCNKREQSWIDLACHLESLVDELVYDWDDNDTQPEKEDETTTTAHPMMLLTLISWIYHNVAVPRDRRCLQRRREQQHPQPDYDALETVADSYLDWAIACKRANRRSDCYQAHRRRMELLPNLKILDSVRLLGSVCCTEDKDKNGICVIKVEEICKEGIFQQTSEWKQSVSNKDQNNYYEACYPSQSSIDIGKQVRTILQSANYTMAKCQHLLLDLASSDPTATNPKMTNINRSRRDVNFFLSADTFFRYRSEWMLLRNDCQQDDDATDVDMFQLLASLFLFGLAVPIEDLKMKIADQNVSETLFHARLICIHPMDPNYVIPEVQIFPIDVNAFETTTISNDKEITTTMLFMTDWNLESMRLPKNAIMSVGYDTAELLSLSSGIQELFSLSTSRVDDNQKQGQTPPLRILDVCCGCGIQGLFLAGRAVSAANVNAPCTSNVEELFCMDINPRASHFTTANMALNGLIPKQRGGDGSCSIEICSIWADLFQPMKLSAKPTSQLVRMSALMTAVAPDRIIGKFDFILSNPPFVAVPLANRVPTMSPALYSAGGGFDGMGLLRRMLKDCLQLLSPASATGKILMVTELPNIQESCTLIQNLLRGDGERSSETSVAGSSSNAAIYSSSSREGSPTLTPKRDQPEVRIAYVEEDVETIQDYVTEREQEAGCYIQGRDWSSNPNNYCDMHTIYNRALALVSITLQQQQQPCRDGDSSIQANQKKVARNSDDVFGFHGQNALMILKDECIKMTSSDSHAFADTDISIAGRIEMDALLEEQDAFLTNEGIGFTRKFLL